MDWQTLAVPGALWVVSLLGVLVVRRGVRIDDHPLCRKCGFDLTGKPPTSSRCAECGADLNRRKAIRIGHRRANRRAFAATSVATIAFGAWFAITAFAQIRGVNWDHHKPFSWLIDEADSQDTGTRSGAFAELVRRTAEDLLDREAEDQLVQAAMTRQADWNLFWVGEWGTIMERLESKGRLPAEQRYQYRLNSIALVPGSVKVDRHYVTLEIDRTPLRLSSFAAQSTGILDTVGLVYAEPIALLDGKGIEIDISHPWAGQSGAYKADHLYMPEDENLKPICLVPTVPDNPTVEILLERDQLQDYGVAEGPHVLRVNLVLRHRSVTYPKGHIEAPAWGTTRLERRVSIDLPFDMPPPLAAVDSSAGTIDVRSAIRISDVVIGDPQANSDRVRLRIGVDRPPVHLALTARIFVDSYTHSAAHKTVIRCRKGESVAPQEFEFVLSQPIPRGSVGNMELILEPDRDQQELTPIWGYIVRFESIHSRAVSD